MKKLIFPSRSTEWSKLASICVLATTAFVTTGCGSAPAPEGKAEKSDTSSSVASGDPKESSAPPAQSQSAGNQTADKPKVEAEISSFDELQSAQNVSADKSDAKAKEVAKVQADPATAKQAISALNLLELPRLESDTLLQEGPTYLYYSCNAKLTEADGFYQELFKKGGWEELPAITPPTEHYIDRIFSKNGFFVRTSICVGGQPGELGIMLANLGNVDVRELPKLSDAEVMFQSTPVNLTYQTLSSIPDAAAAVQKEMLAQGWQLWQEFHDNPVSVPHYKDLHFRKGACRLLVGVVKNPQNPADKTSVSYIAEFVTPFDVPMLKDSQTLKLDVNSKRASFDATDSRKELVDLLQSNSESFGWKLKDAEKFAAGEVHLIPIDLESGEYMVARLVESGGKYSASLESFAKAPESVLPAADAVASSEEKSGEPAEPMEKDSTAADLEAQINSAVQGELAKALGSLGKSSGDSPQNMAELEAKAKQLQNMLADGDDSDGEENADKKEMKENPFDVEEDTEAPSAEVQAIKKSKCTIKVGNKTIELPHRACYVFNDDGLAVKCILFSDKPIDVAKLQRLLLKDGQPVHGMYVSDGSTKMLDFRIYGESLSLNAQVDSSSLGLSSGSIPMEVSYHQGKMIGKIETIEPIELSEGTLEFSVQVYEEPIRVDWAKRGSPETEKLVADESKEVLVPEGCTSFSSEGSRYSSQIEAIIEVPLPAVQTFYTEQLELKGYKLVDDDSENGKRYQSNEQELILTLKANDDETVIEMQTRNLAAAKADAMLPPKGKALLVLGNMSQAVVEMTIAGKAYKVEPSDGRDPKDATKVVVEPGAVKIRIVAEKGGKPYDMEVKATADSTWGVLFDTSFQDVLQLF